MRVVLLDLLTYEHGGRAGDQRGGEGESEHPAIRLRARRLHGRCRLPCVACRTGLRRGRSGVHENHLLAPKGWREYAFAARAGRRTSGTPRPFLVPTIMTFGTRCHNQGTSCLSPQLATSRAITIAVRETTCWLDLAARCIVSSLRRLWLLPCSGGRQGTGTLAGLAGTTRCGWSAGDRSTPSDWQR